MNWENGTWESPGAADPVADIIIAGDWAPIREFSDIVLADPEAVYGDLLPVMKNCDLRMVNLECPLVDTGTPVHKSGTVLKGVSDHIHGLTTVPFEVVTLGNNHVFDYGIDAFTQTLDLLGRNGIQSTGAGMTVTEAEHPLLITVKGVRIGIISFSEGEDLSAAADGVPGVLGWEVERVIERIREIRSQVHVVIVICHAGVEYIPFPPPYLAEALKQIAASGADLVIGHHPHVPQGVQIHKHVPICYSLGNFVFFQPVDLSYRKLGYLVKAGLSTDGVSTIQIMPYKIGSDRLTLLKDNNLRRMLKKLDTISAPLTDKGGIDDTWHGFLKYYGTEGFKNEIFGIMDRFENDTRKAAAMFRNRLTTLQHFHHLKDLMTRIIDGTLDDAPEWAVAEVDEYFNRKVVEGLP
jgi:poly-gamma-glutamate synthesis protein (capsule biosynthesis protein)